MISAPSFPPVGAQGCAVFDLSGRTRLLFSGADRLRYLNGQLTQDLKRLAPGRALPACVTSAKGRLQAEVWASFEGGADGPIALDAASELREALAARLERYIVADEVVLEDHTGRAGLLHCIGFAPGQAASPEGSQAPFQTPTGAGVDATMPMDAPMDPSAGNPMGTAVGVEDSASALEFPAVLRDLPRVAAFRLGQEGWDVRVPLDRLDAVKQALEGSLATDADWETLRISRGIPVWGAELDENTLPPEAGLERTHIDYHKGCYIGQEVISRLKSVGHVNRTLCRFLGSGPERPARGTVFFTTTGVEAGVLTSVAGAGAEGFVALGYVKRACAAETSFMCGKTVLKTIAGETIDARRIH